MYRRGATAAICSCAAGACELVRVPPSTQRFRPNLRTLSPVSASRSHFAHQALRRARVGRGFCRRATANSVYRRFQGLFPARVRVQVWVCPSRPACHTEMPRTPRNVEVKRYHPVCNSTKNTDECKAPHDNYARIYIDTIHSCSIGYMHRITASPSIPAPRHDISTPSTARCERHQNRVVSGGVSCATRSMLMFDDTVDH
jgi:hypothetical protein